MHRGWSRSGCESQLKSQELGAGPKPFVSADINLLECVSKSTHDSVLALSARTIATLTLVSSRTAQAYRKLRAHEKALHSGARGMDLD